MKKTISLILALVLCLSLCACSGGETEKVPAEVDELAFLTEATWGKVFDGKTKLKFAEDGTGTYSDKELTWEMWDGAVVFRYTSTSYYGNTSLIEVTCNIIEHNGIKMLVSDGAIYVPGTNFKEGCAAAKEYMISVAEELNWADAYAQYQSNAARAEAEYDGKIVKWTATIFEISESSCRMANETYNGLALNAVDVYMDTEELVKLDKDQEVTVIGFMDVGSFSHIFCGFVVE